MTGPFYYTEPVGKQASTGGFKQCLGIGFDASKSNQIFSGDSMQPKSGQVFVCVKI